MDEIYTIKSITFEKFGYAATFDTNDTLTNEKSGSAGLILLNKLFAVYREKQETPIYLKKIKFATFSSEIAVGDVINVRVQADVRSGRFQVEAVRPDGSKFAEARCEIAQQAEN